MRPLPNDEGCNLQIRESGHGAPLVLIHGWATSSSIWAKTVERLSGTNRCLAVDLRGHGTTPAPPRQFTIRDHASDLAQLAARPGLGRPVLLGWSMGAQVALEAAALLGDRLAGLILVAGTARFSAGPGYPHGLPPEEVDGLAARLRRSPLKALRRFFAGMFADGELTGEERRLQAEALAGASPDGATTLAALSALAQEDARLLLPSIHVPVLLIHGERDPIVPASASTFLAGQLPRARLSIFPGAGHAPFLTCAERFHALVADFLEWIERGEAASSLRPLGVEWIERGEAASSLRPLGTR